MDADQMNLATAVIGLIAAALVLGSIVVPLLPNKRGESQESVTKARQGLLLGLQVAYASLMLGALILLFYRMGFLSIAIAALGVVALVAHFQLSKGPPTRNEIASLVVAVGIVACLLTVVGLERLVDIQERMLTVQEKMLNMPGEENGK